MRYGLLAKVIACLSLFLINPSVAKELNSQQYDARLCSAQLLVIKGDLARLQLKRTKEHHKTGLKQRITGALGSLYWLCKQHSYSTHLNNLKSTLLKDTFNTVRLMFRTGNWQNTDENLDTLISAMPLNIDNFESQNLSKKVLKTSVSIYQHYCKACHHQPSDKSETPAFSLFEMAKNMSRKELLSRMLVGVHGKPKIALRNPLTDDDISGLIAYFSKVKSLN